MGIDIPHWIDKEAWDAFTEMRLKKEKISKKCPWTEGAAKWVIRELGHLYAQGEDPNECLWQSVGMGWTGVFEVKKKPKPPTHQEYRSEAPEPSVSPERRAEVAEMLRQAKARLTRH